MLHKVIINILSFFNLSNIVMILQGFPIASDMYASYGLTNQMPNNFVFIYNCRFLFWILLILNIVFLLWYNIFFNKNRRTEKAESYKKTSIIACIILGLILIASLLLYVFFILKPIMNLYMASFLFEANGI